MKTTFIRQAAWLSLFIVGACDFDSIELDKVQGPTIKNTFAINLGSIQYTASELVETLEDETLEVQEGNDLSLALIHQDTSIFDDIDDFILLKDDISNSDEYTPFDTNIPAQLTENVVVIPTRIFDFEFNSEGGEKIDSTFFKGGLLEYTFSSPFNVQVDYVFTLIDVLDETNNPVRFISELTESEAGKTESIPLNGLKNVAERVGSANVFNVSLDLTFTIPAGKTISASEEVSIELSFRNTEFSAVFGDFGVEPKDVQEDTITFDSFDEFSDSGLFLRSPSIRMDFVNLFGVELGISLEAIKSRDESGAEIQLSGTVVDELQFVDAPNNNDLGKSVNSSFSIDIDNSNIDELLNRTPEHLIFSVSAEPNPIGSDNLNNYLFDSSYLEIRTRVEMPLDFRMDGFSKDFDLDLSGNDINGADSLIINARIVNELPLNGSLDLSFIDVNGSELYQIASLDLIQSPSIGSDGRTVDVAESNASVRLDNEGIEAFLDAEEIIATVNVFTFDSENGTFVQIFSDYKLEIFLTAEGTVEVDL